MPKSATWPDECGRDTPEGPDVPGELGMTCPREEDVTGLKYSRFWLSV